MIKDEFKLKIGGLYKVKQYDSTNWSYAIVLKENGDFPYVFYDENYIEKTDRFWFKQCYELIS